VTKYRAKPTTIDGIRFASKAEARRYQELKLLERAGEIHNLETHPKYTLSVNNQVICTYTADFRYEESGEVIVEDVKSRPTMTPVYRLKKKLMKAIYNIDIKEVMG
jgi:hypothetical protein